MYIYICRSIYIYIQLHFCVRCPTHVYTHTYTCLGTNIHQGRNRLLFTKWFCHYQLLLEIPLTLCPSYTLSVCVCFFLVCCFVRSAWNWSPWKEVSVQVNHLHLFVMKYGWVLEIIIDLPIESRVFFENRKWVSKGCGSYLIYPGFRQLNEDV